METLSNSEVKAAVDSALAAAQVRKTEAETKAAIAAALDAAGLAAWAEVKLQSQLKENWTGPVFLKAIDTSNIWRSSKGDVINSWMSTDRMEGWNLRVRFINEPGQPEVCFIPFKKQGRELCGMRPERAGSWEVDIWKSLVAGVSRRRPRKFEVQYKYEQREQSPAETPEDATPSEQESRSRSSFAATLDQRRMIRQQVVENMRRNPLSDSSPKFNRSEMYDRG